MLAPASVPFNPVFFLFFFPLYILLNNLHLHFLNLSLNKFGSGKTKSVPHSPGLPYVKVISIFHLIDISENETNEVNFREIPQK
jgi:hypothetical protein